MPAQTPAPPATWDPPEPPPLSAVRRTIKGEPFLEVGRSGDDVRLPSPDPSLLSPPPVTPPPSLRFWPVYSASTSPSRDESTEVRKFLVGVVADSNDPETDER